MLEEEKVGSLMMARCASVEFPCQYKAARCCKYIHAHTVKCKQSLKIVETADGFFSHATLMKPQVTGLHCHVLFFILPEEQQSPFRFSDSTTTRSANHNHDKQVLGLYPHVNKSVGRWSEHQRN